MMLAFGAAAGLVGQTLTYPFDVVRRQMQVEGLKLHEAAAHSPARQLSLGGAFASSAGAAGAAAAQQQQLSLRSTPRALVLLAQQHGWRCLFAGLHINYLKVGWGRRDGSPAGTNWLAATSAIWAACWPGRTK
jgi:solute carrier family 25 protein 16